MRRGPALAVLLCLLGAFLVLVAAGRTWLSGVEALPAPLPARDVALTAADLGLALQALGLVGLAGVPALAATRRTGRVVVGVLLLLAGVLVVVRAAGVLLDPDAAADAASTDPAGLSLTAWPAVAGAGGLLLAGAGLLVAVRGRRWAALGRRYEAPGSPVPLEPETAGPVAERELWEALDRGEDPTGRSGG